MFLEITVFCTFQSEAPSFICINCLCRFFFMSKVFWTEDTGRENIDVLMFSLYVCSFTDVSYFTTVRKEQEREVNPE